MSTDLDALLPDDEKTAAERAYRMALRIKQLDAEGGDIADFPEFTTWNYGPCAYHDQPVVGCEYRSCGGPLWRLQRTGIMWAYAVRQGILADIPGLGKTGTALGLVAFLHHRHELTNRAIAVINTPAVEQWAKEARRWVPGLNVIASMPGMSRSDRHEQYVYSNWDLLVIGNHMVLQDRYQLQQLEPGLVIADDVDALRNENKTSLTFENLCEAAERILIMNATPQQIHLEELYVTARPIGGRQIFGMAPEVFERKYVKKRRVTEHDLSKGGRKTTRYKKVGYKNLGDFKTKLAPIYLRRGEEALEGDTKMPEVMPPIDHWLELSPEQKARYRELQRGVVKLKREEGEKLRHAAAWTQFTYGAEICAGLMTLGDADGPGASVKLDKLMDLLDHEWAPGTGEKVIVFTRWVPIVKALYARLKGQGETMAIIMGGQTGSKAKAAVREANKDLFWNDPKCRVLCGTSSLERSLNLQVARNVVNFDSWLNPARMRQILGRARRADSRHRHIFVHNLFTVGTQEEAYPRILSRRAALTDFINDEEGEGLFQTLSPIELLDLISP